MKDAPVCSGCLNTKMNPRGPFLVGEARSGRHAVCGAFWQLPASHCMLSHSNMQLQQLSTLNCLPLRAPAPSQGAGLVGEARCPGKALRVVRGVPAAARAPLRGLEDEEFSNLQCLSLRSPVPSQGAGVVGGAASGAGQSAAAGASLRSLHLEESNPSTSISESICAFAGSRLGGRSQARREGAASGAGRSSGCARTTARPASAAWTRMTTTAPGWAPASAPATSQCEAQSNWRPLPEIVLPSGTAQYRSTLFTRI